MRDFIVKSLTAADLKAEIEKIGFDSGYLPKAVNKFIYKNIKIFNLSSAQANILKQTAISVGADCATNRNVITGKAEISDAILGGSYSQLKKIAEKLRFQPFSLFNLGKLILNELDMKSNKTQLVGILNITPDSFSDGGMFINPLSAIEHARKLVNDGASIIDIGAESTKPYSEAVDDEEQIRRLEPVLEGLKDLNTPLSLDTRSSKVAEFGLKNGITIINDVSGFDYDKKIADIIAEYGASVIIQHSQGTPDVMQINPKYNDVIEDIYTGLAKKIEYAESKGIKNIIIDPGIGFGKTKKDNLVILNRIEEFYSLGKPVMVGVSRKSFLGVNDDNNGLKDTLTLAISAPLIEKHVDFLRVHNVKLHKQLLDLTI